MRGWTAFLGAFGVGLALALPISPASAEDCLADWSVAAPIVKREGLVTVEALSVLVRKHHKSDIVKASLCDGGAGAFAYRLVVRGASGQLRTVVVDAREPFKP